MASLLSYQAHQFYDALHMGVREHFSSDPRFPLRGNVEGETSFSMYGEEMRLFVRSQSYRYATSSLLRIDLLLYRLSERDALLRETCAALYDEVWSHRAYHFSSLWC